MNTRVYSKLVIKQTTKVDCFSTAGCFLSESIG